MAGEEHALEPEGDVADAAGARARTIVQAREGNRELDLIARAQPALVRKLGVDVRGVRVATPKVSIASLFGKRLLGSQRTGEVQFAARVSVAAAQAAQIADDGVDLRRM